MSIEWDILGNPGADNALLVTVDSGQSVKRVLFDCGEGCLSSQRVSTIQSIDHLCFSHFHMDHVSGFDTFFRHNYNRPDIPVQVWGPADTIDVMHHRFRSFTWNLHENQAGEWIVREVNGDTISGARFHTYEAFSEAHAMPETPLGKNRLYEGRHFRIESIQLPHHTIRSAAYRLVEADRQNVCPEALQKSGFAPGPWLQSLTNPEARGAVEVGGRELSLDDLRSDLLQSTPGHSIAYFTDFRIDRETEAWNEVCNWLSGTETLVSECQYHSRDESLARRHGHMTSAAVGQLATEANIGDLVLVHLSRRYRAGEWNDLLTEARTEFRGARFPDPWDIPE